jgi:hypothetical protein
MKALFIVVLAMLGVLLVMLMMVWTKGLFVVLVLFGIALYGVYQYLDFHEKD